MAPDPLRVACWRFEQISPLLDGRVTRAERHRKMEAMARVPVLWPSGREAPVPVRSLYRWLKLYRREPRIESLMRKAGRKTKCPAAIQPAWMQYALALLEEEPDRSLFVLTRSIQARFRLPKAPSRSSLHRALLKEPRYRQLRRRARGECRLRVRFQAAAPHLIWHGDALRAFWVRFADGRKIQVRILSALDDATRYALRALIALSESTAAAVAVFRQAAGRWGLPDKFYADRHSVYDSDVFRQALAILGVHRINTRSRNAPAHGKIEAYHRTIHRWFTKELRHQLVADLRHLQELLDAVIEELYHEHVHRELKQTPRQALAGRYSGRLVSQERLWEAFLIRKEVVADKKTGSIRIQGRLFRVPRCFLAAPKVKIAIDPEHPERPYLAVKTGLLVPLESAIREAGSAKKDEDSKPRPEPAGSLTPLLEKYRGRTLPQAKPGFGLPEIYQALSKALGREVPATEAEATTVLEWLATAGPFAPEPFHEALAKTMRHLGPGRPLAQIIKALETRIAPASKDERS